MSAPSVAQLLREATSLAALTLHRPWPFAVVRLGKDVENRTWEPPARVVGKALALHAGLTYSQEAAEGIREELGLQVPSKGADAASAVVGVAVLSGSRRDSPSRWAIPGQVHWLLEGAVALPRPVACKGAQGLWQLPPEVFAQVRAQVLEEHDTHRALVALSPTEGPSAGLEKALAEAAHATRRPSHRVHSKGSARGAGPQVVHSTVWVPATRQPMEPCVWCGTWWTGGREGPHAPRLALEHAHAEGWPECEHGRAFLVDCAGNLAAPCCCAAAYRQSGAPFCAEAVAAGVLP